MPHNRCCPVKKKKKKKYLKIVNCTKKTTRTQPVCSHCCHLVTDREVSAATPPDYSSTPPAVRLILGTPLNKKVFVILFYSVMYYNHTKLSFVLHSECKITNKLSFTFWAGLFLACWLWYFPIIHRVFKSFVFSILRCGNIFPVI